MEHFSRLKDWTKKKWEAWIDWPSAVGKVFADRYQVINVLGMGSYGISYLCEDLQSGQKCVVKQVKPSKKGTTLGIQAYHYEAMLLQQLNHPAIPKFYTKFEDHGNLFISMEYVTGKNLEDLIFDEDVKFSEQQALQIMISLLNTIEYLHTQGVIHRDIRIPNVMVDDNQQLRLIDFGLARRIGDPDDHGIHLDSPIEQKLRRAIEVRSDFYALGHFLLFLLYTTFESSEESEDLGWEEELNLHPATRSLIRRCLQLDMPFSDVQELRNSVLLALDPNC
ncbi:serine/threonine protein kinase [Ammoniphilus resinae]|uniref:non-specific serine/threonine protein kinase n=1 Tax=Ammoniphilus resinae TaxID=861532 RepID=A0ABS4GJ58_9BACL|nr:serine/threonine-protein kinase [Ammoniphilus resinae]MBP1930293.1 serine/threonine-protein kinase [Ammoniphilus resinae]